MTKYEQFQLEMSVKLLSGKSNTDIYRSFYEEMKGTGLHVKPEDILLLYSRIPEAAPSSDKYSVVYNGVDTVIAEKFTVKLQASTYDPDVFQNDKLKNIIPHDFGDGYQWTLTGYGEEGIPFGLNQWVVDGYTGTLAFTGGFPDGYLTPLTLTAWRYCGPTGIGNVLLSDGSVPLMDGYTPVNDRDVPTKKYVDDKVQKVEDIVNILVPAEPETFKDKELVLESNSFEAIRVSDSTPFSRVVLSTDDVKVRVPAFFNIGSGTVSAVINGVDVSNYSLKDLEAGVHGYFNVESIDDAYEGSTSGEGFFKVVKSCLVFSPKIFASLTTPYLDIVVKYKGSTEFETQHILIGVEFMRPEHSIAQIYADAVNNPKYVSGVPALTKESSVDIKFTLSTLDIYRQAVIGTAGVDSPLSELSAATTYTSVYPDSAQLFTYIPSANGEQFTFMATSIDSRGKESCSVSKAFPFRIDISDETVRLTPGAGLYPETFGSVYDSEASIESTNDLQLYQGAYRFPDGDYTKNASFIVTDKSNGKWIAGPDYSGISEGVSRYALFKFTIDEYCRGIFLSVNNAIGFGMDKDTKLYENIHAFQLLASGLTGWLDINAPYNGFGNPSKNGDACLVVAKSDESRRYITFGKNSFKGDIYVRIGFSKRGISFKNIEVSELLR